MSKFYNNYNIHKKRKESKFSYCLSESIWTGVAYRNLFFPASFSLSCPPAFIYPQNLQLPFLFSPLAAFLQTSVALLAAWSGWAQLCSAKQAQLFCNGCHLWAPLYGAICYPQAQLCSAVCSIRPRYVVPSVLEAGPRVLWKKMLLCQA